MSDSHIKIRTAKNWQGKEPFFVFQSSFSGIKKEDLFIKKFFVELDTRQASFGIRLCEQKPTNLATQGGMVNMMRKYCKGATIGEISKDHSNGNLWLTLFSQGQVYYLLLAKSRPPELSLIDPEGISLMRLGMKGTFTKKSRYEGELPANNEKITSIKSELIAAFREEILAKQAQEEESEDLGEDHDESDELSQTQRQLLQKLKRKLKTYQKALDKQISQTPTSESIEESSLKATMLQNFGYLVKDGQFELDLPKEISGLTSDLTIPLDPEKNLGANIEAYFVKAKKQKRSLEMGTNMIERNRIEVKQLKSTIDSVKSPLEHYRTLEIAESYKIRLSTQVSQNKNKLESVSKPYKEFRSSDGHRILVGKGPKENDELTKSAKANDYWIHTAGVAGSHVIIPVTKEIKSSLPEPLLKAGAILAIHYSKFKGDQAGEVYLARRSEIKKQKGMPPGLWNVERCKTVFIRYEAKELKQLLDSMIQTGS
ncbi:MAG: fibronectin/fibrinogen-binding protein [Pseudobacteriovorax sp.]|nr:fibronectin/fibrinogen-binding protein [Pseudobacteriovorax sp.]